LEKIFDHLRKFLPLEEETGRGVTNPSALRATPFGKGRYNSHPPLTPPIKGGEIMLINL
jgi:hypothetical protein